MEKEWCYLSSVRRRGFLMNIYEFMSGNPWLTFFMLCGMTVTVRIVFTCLVVIPVRAINIRRHGWPPPHCDADGDFKGKKE